MDEVKTRSFLILGEFQTHLHMLAIPTGPAYRLLACVQVRVGNIGGVNDSRSLRCVDRRSRCLQRCSLGYDERIFFVDIPI